MPALKYGLTTIMTGARDVAKIAQIAEASGWDGLFLGDAIWCQDPVIALAAAAMTTSRLRLGTMVTPAPIRIPWKLASEALSLDHLSNGRMTLALGKGAEWMGWQAFPQSETDPKARAEMLDETIDILTRLFQSKSFDYDGKHYQLKLTQLDEIHYPPKPIQQPCVPLWVVATWGIQKSMQRALKADGILPFAWDKSGKNTVSATPGDLVEIKAFIEARREPAAPYDYVIGGETAGLDAAGIRDLLCPWRDAGMTWWIESLMGSSAEPMIERVKQGPPRID